MYRNAEGYPDPTAGAVYSAIQREELRREADILAVMREAKWKYEQRKRRTGHPRKEEI